MNLAFLSHKRIYTDNTRHEFLRTEVNLIGRPYEKLSPTFKREPSNSKVRWWTQTSPAVSGDVHMEREHIYKDIPLRRRLDAISSESVRNARVSRKQYAIQR